MLNELNHTTYYCLWCCSSGVWVGLLWTRVFVFRAVLFYLLRSWREFELRVPVETGRAEVAPAGGGWGRRRASPTLRLIYGHVFATRQLQGQGWVVYSLGVQTGHYSHWIAIMNTYKIFYGYHWSVSIFLRNCLGNLNIFGRILKPCTCDNEAVLLYKKY